METNKKILNQDFKVKNGENHSVEHLQFVFSQAEKKLEDSSHTIDLTTNKTFTIISVLVTMVSALLAYVFLNFDINGDYDLKLSTSLLLSIYIFCILIYVSKNLKHVSYNPVGSSPHELLSTRETVNLNNELSHYKYTLYNEIVSYHNRIKFNYKENEKRVVVIDKSINLLISIPIVFFAFFLLSLLATGFLSLLS